MSACMQELPPKNVVGTMASRRRNVFARSLPFSNPASGGPAVFAQSTALHGAAGWGHYIKRPFSCLSCSPAPASCTGRSDLPFEYDGNHAYTQSGSWWHSGVILECGIGLRTCCAL